VFLARALPIGLAFDLAFLRVLHRLRGTWGWAGIAPMGDPLVQAILSPWSTCSGSVSRPLWMGHERIRLNLRNRRMRGEYALLKEKSVPPTSAHGLRRGLTLESHQPV
jgi:hypothetical protein